jgi:glycosyltransferase involved in cell wall biosynthesis
MKKITVVSPCYNEEENVEACHLAVRTLFEGPLAGYEREHIFADNASADRTQAILRDIAATDPCVKVVLNARNYGPFRSNFNALRYATGDAVVVFLAVDLQDPPEVIVDFVRHWEAGAEVVAGARVNRQESLLLRTCRAIFYRLVKALSEIDIPVNVGEFQLIDRKVWSAVIQHNDHYPYIRGLIASVGFNRVIIPYTWKTRKAGISKNNVLRLIDQALNGIFSFTNAPLRVHPVFAVRGHILPVRSQYGATRYHDADRLAVLPVRRPARLYWHAGRIRHVNPRSGPPRPDGRGA